MKRVCVLLLVALIVLAGCKKEPPPPPPAPPPPPPPPPTAEELSKPVMDKLTPLLMPGARDATMPQGIVGEAAKSLAREENGPKALMMISSELKKLLRNTRDAAAGKDDLNQWHLVRVLCETLGVLEKNDARIAQYLEEAKLELARPRAKITGFVEDNETGAITWFLELTYPETGKVERITAREGEEFSDMQLLSVIGDRRGIKLLYKKTNQTFDVPYQKK